jgi:hypothetical protein
MKTFVLCGIAAMMVAPALAQSSADPANKRVTLTGCVGSSADASGFTLSDAVVVPEFAPPAAGVPPASSAAVPPPASAAAVPPASAAAPPRSTATPPRSPAAPAASPAQIVPPANPTQTVPPAGTAAVGTAGAAPATVTPTTGVVSGGTPANVPGPGGYRLSGTDMTSWAGQRVQVVGTFSPSAAMPAGSTAVGQSGAPSAPPLEFRVQSVQPILGSCPGK